MPSQIIRAVMATLIFAGAAASMSWAVILTDRAAQQQVQMDNGKAERISDDDGPESALQAPPQGGHPPRTAHTRIWLNPTGAEGTMIHVEHVVRVNPADPIVPWMRSGQAFGDSEWVERFSGFLLFDGLGPDYERPTLLVQPDSDVVIRIKGYVHDELEENSEPSDETVAVLARLEPNEQTILPAEHHGQRKRLDSTGHQRTAAGTAGRALARLPVTCCENEHARVGKAWNVS
ncbi:MAG: hypothetical protein ACRDOO_09725 [Actinomadura sp.]